jgi:hypothetical protein
MIDRLLLAGNLARVEAQGLFVHVQSRNLAPVRLAFVWVQASQGKVLSALDSNGKAVKCRFWG